MFLRPIDRFGALLGLFLAPAGTLLVLFLAGFIMMNSHRKVDPVDTPLEFTQQGLNLVSAGQTTTAIANFNQALAINSQYTPALQGIAVARLQEGNKAEADRYFSKALAQYKGQGEAIAAMYLENEVKALKEGRNIPCLHFLDNGRLLCSPI